MRLGILDCDRLDPIWWGFWSRLLRDVYQGFPGAGPELEFRVWSALDGDLPRI